MELFVTGLPLDIKDEEFRDLFSQYSSVCSTFLVKDKETKKSRGFGFVKMNNTIEAMMAISAIIKFRSKRVFVKEAISKAQEAL